MGTAGIMPSTIALFVLWMLTTVPAISARSHRCKYNEIKTTTATDLCSNFIERFKEGYDLNRDSMPDDVDLSKATDCQYIKKEQKEVVGCCLGWSGPACDKPECEGCDQGQCIELQGSGVPASAPPYCRCFDGFGGKKCDEDLSQLKKSTQYCFEDSNCEGKKTSPDVMARSECCTGGSGSWGSSTLSECTPCESMQAETNETMTVELDRVTCMTAGEDIFRTFDDARFTYYSTCTIALLRSTNGLEVYTQTVCDANNKCNCKKVVTVNYVKNSKKYSLVVNDDSITATGPEGTDNIPITEEKGSIGNNIVFKRDSESVFFWFLNEDLSFRRDDSGLFMLTIKKTSPLLGTISGICGDFDGRSDNDQANLDTLFEQNTDAEAPCGNGFTECPASMVDEASSACDYLRGNLFRSCLIKGVDSTPYYDLCMRAYCTANENGQDKADLARCNVLDMFAHTCYKQANVAIRWRSQDFCPKSCDNGMVYQPNVMTNCPLTCGMSDKSYFAQSCKTDGHATCECPAGLFKQNGTCVQAEDCQCKGDDQRYYSKGDVIRSSDNCLQCTCGVNGLWDCEDSPDDCMGVCSVTGNSVLTFDGMTYAFQVESCSLTLLQDQSGKNKVEMLTKSCGGEGQSCLRGLQVTVDGELKGSLMASPNGEGIIENGFTNLKLYIRKVSQNYYAIDINPGIRILVSLDGIIQLEVQTALYRGQTYGLCGTLNGDIKDEMSSLSGSQTDDSSFLKVYGDCTLPVKKPITESAEQNTVCDQLNTANMPATSRVNVDTTKKLCLDKGSTKEKCQVLRAFALALKMPMAEIFGQQDRCTYCTELQKNICETNCIDFSFPYCREESIYDCGCREEDERYSGNSCIDKSNCGCYNMNTTTLIAAGEKITTGCSECTCTGYEMECETACEQVICAAGQTAWAELQGEGECARKMCPAQYQVEKKCIEKVRPNQQCYCPKDFYQTYTDECVQKCPCFAGGSWFDDGYSFTRQCKTKTCKDGFWETTESGDCTGTCIMSGSSLRLKQFDEDSMSDKPLNSNCEYTFFSAGGYEVKVKAMYCGSGMQGCGHKVTITVPFLTQGPIELYRGTEGIIMYNNQAYSSNLGPQVVISSTGLFTDITFEEKLTVRWSEGLTTQIIVSQNAFTNIKGLCGNFDGKTNNDFVGQDNNPTLSLTDAAKSWADSLCSDAPPEVEDKCAEGTQKKVWAYASCKVITEGEAFGACRKDIGETVVQTYFSNCVKAACTCESGGDCECLCDAIAAFAAECASSGHPGRFRHQRLCPIQCDYGSQYDACGSPCPETCGASNQCENMPCLEGCFCPTGYVRADSNSLQCVPRSECPCEVNGRFVPAGEQITIDCQNCRCTNGTFDCDENDPKCVRKCESYEFKCTSGDCVRRSVTCDEWFDCADGSDEIGCITTNCTGYKCHNGQCKMPEQRCDGVMDCMDNSDEENCEVTCGPNEFKCVEGCIPMSWVCDNHIDCASKEDELNCKECPKNYTHCNQSYCAPVDAFCDGHDDCGDGSDEVGCTTPATTSTLPICEKEEVAITGSTPDVVLVSSPGSRSPDLVFEETGWKPNEGEEGSITMTVTPEDGEQPVLMQFTVKVENVTKLELRLLNSNDDLVLSETFKNPEDVISQSFNQEFTKIVLIADGVLSELLVKACYEPSEEITPSTTTPVSTPTPTSTEIISTSPKECYELMNGEVTVTPENGQENMVSVVMTSTEDTLRMDISMRDDNKQGFITEIVVQYANAASFSMETDDGTVLKQPTTLDSPSGHLTITPDDKLPLPVIIILDKLEISDFVSAKLTDVMGCFEGITPTTPETPTPTPTTTPEETTPKVCEEDEVLHLEDFLGVPLANTDTDGDEKTFTSDGTVRVNYKRERFEPFNLQSLTVQLENVETFSVKYFFFGEDSPVFKSYDIPDDGSLSVPVEGRAVSKIQLVAVPKDGVQAVLKVEELEGCEHPETPTPTVTPTVTVITTPVTEVTTTGCEFQCNDKCFTTWQEFCTSECAPGNCVTEPPSTTTATIGTTPLPGCPIDMTPEVPPGTTPVEGETPGTFVQNNVFEGPQYVEEVPDDDKPGPPDDVYKSVEPGPDDRFRPEPNEPLLIVVRPGETPEEPATEPEDGALTPEDIAENPDSELIARTPLPDGTVEEVYKYTPEDDTPIVVKNPLDVLEKVEPDDEKDFPINQDGPTRVIILSDDDEPRKVTYCGEATTGTPSETTAPPTTGPPTVTTTVPPTVTTTVFTTTTEEVETGLPCQEGAHPLAIDDFRETELPDSTKRQREGLFELPSKEFFTPMSVRFQVTNAVRVIISTIPGGEVERIEPVEDGTQTFTFPADSPLVRAIKVVAVKNPRSPDDMEFTVEEVQACKEVTPPTTTAPPTTTVPPTTTTVTTTTPSSTTPTTPTEEEECRDITAMDSFLISDDSVEVTAQNGNSNPTVDDFVVTYGIDAGSLLIVKVYMPVDGELQAVKLTGDFLDAKIEVQQEGAAIPQLAIPKTGDNKLTPDEYVTFADTSFAPGDIEIRINIQPGTAGTITVEEFIVCAPTIGDMCKINTDEVETALGFKPANDMFGVTAEGQVVEVDSLTYILENMTITGYCYVCECKGNNKLECSFTKNCTEECPDFSEWSECDADCGEQGIRTRTIDDIGFPDSCPSGREEQPCEGSCVTTPVTCTSSWGEWSPCEGCTQKRNRTCNEDNEACDCKPSLEEIRECGSCTTTATTPTSTIECEDNEVYGCTTSESRCEESCMAFRAANDACRGDELPCTPACECKDGFKRNAQGKCVPQEQCECYPPGSNSSIPIGHVVHVDECYECECLETGYECGPKAGCCKVGEWTNWSACSVTCGEGTKTRTRDNEGDCDNPETETETIPCDIPCECEDDTEWYDGCEKCKCINGFADCMPFCEEVTEETCDNKTSVIIDDPDQPCCKKCVQVKNPCRPVKEDTVRLNFTDADRSGGVCVSEPVDIQRCEGSCSDSFMSTKYVFSGRSFKLVKDVGSCECCRPSIVEKEVTFVCGDNDSRTIMVPQIASCVCELCAEPPRS